MTVLISIFGISLAGILALVLIKSRALGNGGETFITRRVPREKDEILRAQFEASVRRVSKRILEIMSAFLHLFAERVAHWTFLFLRFLIKKTVRIRNTIRGRGKLTKKGTASFYLKDIVEHKNNNIDKGGRID